MVATDAENQKRTVALMTELAKRYANETTVIGYQLINEPSFDAGTAKSAADAVKQCKKMMQRIADGIRKYDKNHILFVDNVNSVALENGSVYLKGTKDAVGASGFRFELKDGYKYKVSGYVKKENAGKDTWAVLGVNFYKGEGLYTTNKKYLEHVFSVYLDFSKKNNVPLYLGEYGLTNAALEKGGDKWLADMYDIIAKNKLSTNLHCYHAQYGGLYTGGEWKDLPSPKNKNTQLETIIKKNLKKIK